MDGPVTPTPAPKAASMPRWVKMFALVALILVVAFIILHLSGLAPKGH